MKKIVKFSDSISTNEQFAVNRKSIKTGLDTRIIVTASNCRHNGSKEVNILHNKTVLPGRTQLLENVFPIKPNMQQHIFLNDCVLGRPINALGNISNPVKVGSAPEALWPRNQENLTNFKRRTVAYWCAGNGAVNQSISGQSYPPHINNTKLYNMIPFRFVPQDKLLDNTKASQYKFKVVFDENSPYYGYVGYYLKKINFNSLNGINMTADKQEYIPKWGDTQPNLIDPVLEYESRFKGDVIQSNFIDMSMNIESAEFKEWFAFVDGTLANAEISEIGLVTGLDCYYDSSNSRLEIIEDLDPASEGYNTKAMQSEIYDAELFAHLTFDPYSVSRENATIDFDYRIYS